ncbi:MAG: hypothetical protein K6A71_03545 [Lachnospiraceae bacterium]|nr:hypothetical protein [Lachnospiraceae bacterium]
MKVMTGMLCIIGMTGLLIGGLGCSATAVRAAGRETEISDKVLKVDIVRDDGVSITPRDNEAICSNSALKYTINQAPVPGLFKYTLKSDEKNAGQDELLKYQVTCQYSISSDGGESYSEWADLGGNTFTLIPGCVADGCYSIKFRKIQEYAVKPQEAVIGEPGDSVSENKIYEEKKKAYDENRKKADNIVLNEPLHVIESGTYNIVLDTGVPEVDFSASRNTEEWTNENIKCWLRINDVVSKPSAIRVSLDDEQIMDETYDKNASLSGDEKEFVLSKESVKEEGSELVIEVSDNAGNVNVIRKPVKIDKTVPVIGLEGADERGVYSEPVRISVTGEDAHPGSVCVEYSLKKIYEGNEEVLESTARSLAEVKEGPLFSAVGDGDYIVECRATDMAGNVSQPVRKSFRIDTIAPGISFTGINDGSVINREGELKINAFDNYENDYSVKLTGSVTGGMGTRDLKLADYVTDGKFSVNTYYFKADGEYIINASVTDEAGNTYSDSISFSIDTVAPTVEITGGINLNEDMITNVAPELSFRIKEKNFETAGVVCDLYRLSEDKERELVKSPEWVMNEETSVFTISISEEGAYELNVTAADLAGNTAGKSIKFTLDMTGPEIEYIENLDKKYIKSFRLPDNFSEYIKDKNGVNYKTYINSMNYDEGSEIDEDGKYVLKVSAVDEAGNQAEKSVEFIVDSTQPRVVIDGMADDGSVNKDDTIILSLYDTDDYFRSVKLNGQELVTEDRQQTVELTIPEYGDYTIDVEASDLAENVLTQSIVAKCANASPVSQGASTVRTLKQNDKSGSHKGLRIFLIILTVLILGGSIAVYSIYSIRQERMYQ